MKSNGVCDEVCDNSDCDYDGGDCQECAPGCLMSMLGDGVCNSACNVNDCHYDNYDCGCSEGCGIESYGQCKDSCMNSMCKYDTISETSKCQNSNQILFALHYGLIFKNLVANASPDNCTSSTNCLSTEVLDSSSCHTNCKGAHCIYSWNQCEVITCADQNCLICNTNSLGDCFVCNSNTYQFYGFCLASCPGGHQAVYLIGNYPVCLIPKDYSTKDNPAVYYVTSKTSTDAYEGNGTFNNPFAYLSLALASIYNRHAIIYLLNDGDHYFTCVNTSNPVSTILSDVCDPLSKSFSLENLVIDSYDGSMIAIKKKADHDFFTFKVPSTTTLTIKNVVFNGQDVLSTCPSETNPYCSYCAYITLSSDGHYYSDQRTVVSNYLDSSICNTFHAKSLFSLYLGANLEMKNVNFTDWRMELKTLITSYGANIIFNNVNFDNIRCMWGVTAIQLGQATPEQEKNAVIYFLDCGDANYNCGSFEYTNGVVSRLNNGYEYGVAQFSGFLSADKIRTVKLKNVTFVNNIAYNPSIASTAYSLIKLILYRSIEISQCVFEKNSANFGLIYLEPLALVFRNDVNSNNELIDLLLYHIYIHDTIFKTNYGLYGGILTAIYESQLQKILIENLVMDGNGVESASLISLYNQLYPYSQYITDTNENIYDTNGNFVEATFKKRTFIIKNSIITHNYSGSYTIFYIIHLVNVHMSNITVESNGNTETQNINTVLWNYYVSDNTLYPKTMVSDPASLEFIYLAVFNLVYNYEISESIFKKNDCKIWSPSFFFSYCGNITISSCIFEENIALYSQGICFNTAYTRNIRIINSTFKSNINSYSHGFGPICLDMSLENTLIENTMIYNNSASFSSGIYYRGDSLALNNVTFESNTANSGLGALYFSVFTGLLTRAIDIKNSFFKKNKSGDAKGGAIYISGTSLSQDDINLSITDTEFQYNSAPSGSAIYIENDATLSTNSIVDSCIFAYNTANNKGTIAIFFQLGILKFSNSVFLSNHADLGSGLYFAASEQSSSDKSKIILTSCNFTENSGQNILCSENIAIFSYIESAKCLFQNNEGSAIYLAHGYWQDTNTIIANSTTNAGTVYLALSASADCQLTEFTNNTSTSYAGAFRAEGNSYFYCSKCIFTKNSAEYGGVLYFDQLSYFLIEDSIFNKNFCYKNGAILYIIGSAEYSILKNSLLFYNYAESEGLVYSITSNIQIENCEIHENTASGITPGIYLTLSNATISNSQFKDHEGNSGSFVHLTSDSKLIATNSSFTNGKSSKSGGSIYALSSSVSLTDCLFLKSASLSGNTILAFSTALNISQCQFLNSYSSGSGGVISVFGSKIFIEKSFFENFSYSAIDGLEIETLEIRETSFKNSLGKVGGVISCINTDYVYIDSCIFDNNISIYGGALYFIFTSDIINSQPYEIVSNEFRRCTSSVGGAIFVDNVNIDIKLCKFYENKAISTSKSSETSYESGIGGAIKLGCSYSGNCSFNIFSNDLVRNLAEYEGGAIVWKEVMPQFKNNSYQDNEAIYGKNIASYPVNMDILNTNSDDGLKDLASGQLTIAPLIIALVDHLGSIITTDNSSVSELVSTSQDVFLSGELKVIATEGIFNFSSFVISAKPGSNFSIEIQTNAIDPSKSVKANDGLIYNASIPVNVALRDCVLGEATVGVNCVVCAKEFYSLDPKNNKCLTCPNKAVCYGNYTMAPKPGYWRSGMMSTKFWPCPNKNACIGSDPVNISYKGNCEEGYTGNLCQSCEKWYAKIAKNQCAKCQSLAIITVKAIGICLGYVILCCIIIRISKNSAYKPKLLTSVYIKILINYIQLIAITTTFSLSWPSYVKELFSVQNNASFISNQVFSFDCLLYYYEDFKGDNIIYYQKLFLLAIVPISIPIISATFWFLIYLWKRSFEFFIENLVSTSIVAAFLVYPSIIKYYLSSFNCRELDYGKEWLIDDLNLRCWDCQHILYIAAISSPALLIFGIGMPAIILFLISKNKHRLSSIDVRIKYGFLFIGYKSRSYYWEFVIICRKILIICCSLFLSTVSVNIQALTALLVIVSCLYLHFKIKPYIGDNLNRLEAISISCSAITIYCGMYYLSESLDKFTEFIFFIIIILANLYFIFYWIITAGESYIIKIIQKIPFLKKIINPKIFFREDKANIIGDYELIVSTSHKENLNSQGIPFKKISMMDLFFEKLKGCMTIKEESYYENDSNEDKNEKKSIEEGDLENINIEEKNSEENRREGNFQEESSY
ncbi:unnamed protein product [Blepharisma stoltei]|uniref:LNR domain-containing protein n=1 Tax=Blepharisma stoltei TaxID=1481888 RepID=A0AAU9JD98_9CILI|nr:unnamed protein product [Blepharisma stoltei]